MTPLPPRGAWQREPSTLVVDHVDSARVIEAPFSIVSGSVETAVPLEFAPHAHPLHELVWVRGGTMTVRVDDRVLTVPEGRALWIPAGVRHSGRTTAGAVLHDALFDPGRAEVSLDAVTPVEVAGPLAALLDYLATATLSSEARVRAEAVVFDVLVPAPETLELRVPSDARIAAVASALVADPADARTASAWAESVGLSERTLTRLFRAHTGLSFARWRLVLRVHEAIALLSEGHEVQDVAPAVGYSQPSAFIEAFSRVLGVTPGAFAAPSRAV